MTREFEHYDGCNHLDPDNCSGCALTDLRQDAPNYAAWPLAYMENNRVVPVKWREAFIREMTRDDNPAYALNIRSTMARLGVRFTDGLEVNSPTALSLYQMTDNVKANNYDCGVYQDGEIYIQTEPRQLEANKGKVYLTVGNLRALLAMAEASLVRTEPLGKHNYPEED